MLGIISSNVSPLSVLHFSVIALVEKKTLDSFRPHPSISFIFSARCCHSCFYLQSSLHSLNSPTIYPGHAIIKPPGYVCTCKLQHNIHFCYPFDEMNHTATQCPDSRDCSNMRRYLQLWIIMENNIFTPYTQFFYPQPLRSIINCRCAWAVG